MLYGKLAAKLELGEQGEYDFNVPLDSYEEVEALLSVIDNLEDNDIFALNNIVIPVMNHNYANQFISTLTDRAVYIMLSSSFEEDWNPGYIRGINPNICLETAAATLDVILHDITLSGGRGIGGFTNVVVTGFNSAGDLLFVILNHDPMKCSLTRISAALVAEYDEEELTVGWFLKLADTDSSTLHAEVYLGNAFEVITY